MNVAFSPFTGSNKYIEVTTGCIKKSGVNVYEFQRIFLSPKLFYKTDVVILNWFEALDKKWYQKIYKPCLKIFLLLFLKLTGKKIIYVLHNKLNLEGNTNFAYAGFLHFILKMADRIIILSKASRAYLRESIGKKSIENKIRLIPHPDYEGVYKSDIDESNKIIKVPSDKLILLFLGSVRPYKNIEVILEAAKKVRRKNIHFIIAGDPETNKYKSEIEKKAEGLSNVTLKMNFISNKAVSTLIKNSHALILPYDVSRSLNSGTAILAFSNARTVICPMIATVRDFPSEYFYGYDYSSVAEHKQELLKKIIEIYDDYNSDSNEIFDKGEKLFQALLKSNSKKRITKLYSELWQELKRSKRFNHTNFEDYDAATDES